MSREKEIVSSIESWESGALGGDAEFAVPAPDIDQALLDEAVGIKPISIRLDAKMIDELKLFSEMHGMKYQPLIRVILGRWLDAEKKMYLKYRQAENCRQEEIEKQDQGMVDPEPQSKVS